MLCTRGFESHLRRVPLDFFCLLLGRWFHCPSKTTKTILDNCNALKVFAARWSGGKNLASDARGPWFRSPASPYPYLQFQGKFLPSGRKISCARILQSTATSMHISSMTWGLLRDCVINVVRLVKSMWTIAASSVGHHCVQFSPDYSTCFPSSFAPISGAEGVKMKPFLVVYTKRDIHTKR